jgi:F-type H+-transporting ATPase subunit b
VKRANWLAALVVACGVLGAPCYGLQASNHQSTENSQPAPQKNPPANSDANPNLGVQIAQGEDQLAEQSREAEGEGENTEFKHSGSVQFVAKLLGVSVETTYWILFIINFAIVAAAITWFWRSKMPAAFRSRTDSILKSMEVAQQASEDATRRLKDVESRLARLDSEIAQMRSAAEAAAREEELRIRQAVEEDKKRIVESAEQEIDAASRAARAQLKNFAAELAVGLAEKQIRIDAATDHALVRGFGKQLADSGRNGGGKESS